MVVTQTLAVEKRGEAMKLEKPLVEYGAVDIDAFCEKMLRQPKEFWEADRASRKVMAGNRPGNAVFFYTDVPAFANRNPMLEVRNGYVNVLRYPDRILFAELQKMIEDSIVPAFPRCDVLRVQLTELPPGQVITPHYDGNIMALTHRLHVPLVTHAGVKFIIDGQSFFLEPGRLYELNNVVVHSVENNSDVMRVHLLIDMLPHSVARARYYDSERAMISALAA